MSPPDIIIRRQRPPASPHNSPAVPPSTRGSASPPWTPACWAGRSASASSGCRARPHPTAPPPVHGAVGFLPGQVHVLHVAPGGTAPQLPGDQRLQRLGGGQPLLRPVHPQAVHQRQGVQARPQAVHQPPAPRHRPQQPADRRAAHPRRLLRPPQRPRQRHDADALQAGPPPALLRVVHPAVRGGPQALGPLHDVRHLPVPLPQRPRPEAALSPGTTQTVLVLPGTRTTAARPSPTTPRSTTSTASSPAPPTPPWSSC